MNVNKWRVSFTCQFFKSGQELSKNTSYIKYFEEEEGQRTKKYTRVPQENCSDPRLKFIRLKVLLRNLVSLIETVQCLIMRLAFGIT